jgi:hypothetical protein
MIFINSFFNVKPKKGFGTLRMFKSKILSLNEKSEINGLNEKSEINGLNCSLVNNFKFVKYLINRSMSSGIIIRRR